MINFYIVAVPIGNYKDITLRAVEVLKNVDFIVCENEREYKKLFGILSLEYKKFVICNENSEKEATEISLELLKNGEKGALISDCGTPLFEDPGFYLLRAIVEKGYKITSIPGANSIVTAITLSPFKIKDFYFAGFLSQKKEIREKEIIELSKRRECIILMESPHRLFNILDLLKKFMQNRNIYIPYNLTFEDEKIFFGKPDNVEKELEKNSIKKGEFLIVIESKKK